MTVFSDMDIDDSLVQHTKQQSRAKLLGSQSWAENDNNTLGRYDNVTESQISSLVGLSGDLLGKKEPQGLEKVLLAADKRKDKKRQRKVSNLSLLNDSNHEEREFEAL